MDLILCRNVMIYFNRDLQNRVFHLFRDSLRDAGYLCLGDKESPRYSTCSEDFDEIVPKEKIYRKKGDPRGYESAVMAVPRGKA
jgi:chemotaxis protein methyltransferase CheR